MDGDKLTQFEELIVDLDEPESIVTLAAMRETLEQRLAAVQFDLMMQWAAQGWQPNAPGLVCQECGAATYGKQTGSTELVKCTDIFCGAMRTVQVG